MRSLVSATRFSAFTSFARATSKAGKAALVLFSVALLWAVGTTAARGQSALDGFDPNGNGLVRVVVVQPDGKILLGGDFTTVLGVTRNRIARLNPDGTLDTAFNPNANVSVRAIALQADGKILVGGQFDNIGGQTRNRFARLNAATGLADSLNAGAAGIEVDAIAVQADGKILVGGDFFIMGGQARNGVARLDATTGQADSFNPNVSGPVYAMTVQADGKILVGGAFSAAGGNTRRGIARLDPATGLADSFNPEAINGGVYSIAIQADGKILAGGYFTAIGGQTRNGIARLNAMTGLADSFNPDPSGYVRIIALQTDGRILAGGDFTTIGGQTRNRIARLDGNAGLADSFNPNANNSVYSVAVQPDGKILAGGNFLTLAPNGGTAVTRNRVARLEIDGGLDQTLNLNAVGPPPLVFVTAVQPDAKILVGGGFDSVLGVPRNDIARLNADGTLDTVFNPNANGPIYAIAVQADGKILAGGSFTSIGGQSRLRIARLNATTGLADSFDPNASSDVRAIAVQADGKILTGGDFNSIGGQPRHHIARLEAATGLADSFDPNANSSVDSIAVQVDGKILVGGGFFGGIIGGQPRNYIARLDPVTGLADAFNPNPNQAGASIAIQPDGKILVGGFFTSIGGQTRNRIARLEATTGLADSFDPNATERVQSIVVQGDGKILAGGSFTSIGGQQRRSIARLDAATGLADSFDPNPAGDVFSIALQADGKVLVGGSFGSIGGQPRNSVARLSNDTAALQDLAVIQGTVTWTRGGSSAQFTRVTFEYSADNVNYTPLGSGTPAGSNWILTGLSLPTGQNFYIRARGYYRSGYFNGSESITESVRNAFIAPPAVTPTPTPTPPPTPTPHGKIVFMSDPQTFESVPEIYSMDSNGANRTRLTFTGGVQAFNGNPKWSPDGARIVYTRTPIQMNPPQQLPSYIATLDTGALTGGSGGSDSEPSWSLDGAKIAFTSDRDGNREIYVMNSNGSNQTNLTNNPAGDSNSAWSPNGRIAFTRNQDIYVMNGDGSNQINLTNNPTGNSNPAWSPDGTKIAFASGRDGNGEIYVMDANGSNQTRLTNDPANDSNPTWSPDGARIAFRSARSGNDDIYVMNADGSNVMNLTNNTLSDWEPDWQRLLPLPTPSATPTASPTATVTPTASPTATATPTVTPTATPSVTATVSPPPTATPSSTPSPAAQAVNLSTRMRVQTGDNVGIGGFIIAGTAPKYVLLRAIGPSLTQFGVPNALPDPVLELHGPGAFVTITNGNWRDDPVQEAAILATGIAPTNNLESAIAVTLAPAAYTAIVRDNGNVSGVALVEVYDLNQPANSKLANISTRAFVSTGDNIVIGGFLLGGHSGDDRIVVRGIGPSLSAFGVANALADPTLELRDGNGALLAANNNWQDNPAQAAELTAAGLVPTNQLESGIAATLPPGLYTALLAGMNNGTGIGLIEVYDRGGP